MADEVVGEVRVDVHGNTEPLKNDIRRAGAQAGQAIEQGIAQGTSDSAITDHIVEQVSDAEQPAGREAQKVGRAISNGVEVGTRDVDLKSRLDAELKSAEEPLRRQAARIGRSVSKARREATEKAATKAIDDMLVRIRFDVKEPEEMTEIERRWAASGAVIKRQFSKDLNDAQSEFSAFTRSLDDAFDRAFQPIWRKAWARLVSGDGGEEADKAGHTAGQKLGKGVERGLEDQIKRGTLRAMVTKMIGQAFAGLAIKGTLLAFGARAGIALGGGLLTELAVVGEAVTGLVASIAGAAGQALAGIGAVAGGTFATAFAGGYATVLTSIAAVLPAIKGLGLAFKGMEKEEKKALEDRLKKATENLKGFGRAVRAELLPAIFESLESLDKLVPTLNKFGESLGKAAADSVKSFTKMATSGDMIKEINQFLQASVGYFKQLSDAGIDLLSAVLPAFNSISGVTQRFFDDLSAVAGGLAEKIRELTQTGELAATLDQWYSRARSLITTFATFGGAIAKVFSVAATARGDQFLASLKKMADAFDAFIERVTANGQLEQKLGEWYDKAATIGRAFGNLGKIILLFFDTAADAGGTFLDDFENTTDRWLTQFERFRTGGGLGDALKAWFEQGKILIGVIGDLGKVVINVFGAAADAGDGVLESLKDITETWVDWTESVAGEQALQKYFEEARPVIEEVWGLLGDVLKLFSGSFTGDTGNLIGFIQSIRQELIPSIQDIQKSVRDSGLQDSLFQLVDAFGSLLEINGGVLAGFLSAFAIALTAVAKAFELLGPLGPVLVMFMGAMKALSAIKWLVMAAGLKTFTSAFTTFTTAVKTSGGVAAGVGAMAKNVGRLNIAIAGIFAAQGITSLFSSEATEQVKKYDEALSHTSDSLEDIMNQEWDPLDHEKSTRLVELRQRLDGFDGVTGFINDITTGIKDFLGMHATEKAEAEITGLLGAVENLARSGDWSETGRRLTEVSDWLQDSGIDAEHYAEQLDTLQVAIADIVTSDFAPKIEDLVEAGDWEAAATQVGLFAAALEQAGIKGEAADALVQEFVDTVKELAATNTVEFTVPDLDIDQKIIDSLKKIPEYFDKNKGTWKKAGIEAIKALFPDPERIAALKKIPEYFDKNKGKWTKAGKEALAELFPTAEVGDAVQAQLDAIDSSILFRTASGGWTKEGIRMKAEIYAEADLGTINGVHNALSEAAEVKIRAIYADPSKWDPETGQLKVEAQDAVLDLIIRGIDEQRTLVEGMIDGLEQYVIDEFGSYSPLHLRVDLGETQWFDSHTGQWHGSGGRFDILQSLLGDEDAIDTQVNVDDTVARAKIEALKTDTKNNPVVAPLDLDKTEANADIESMRQNLKDNPFIWKVQWDVPPVPLGTSPSGGSRGGSGSSGGSGYPAARSMMVQPSMLSPGAPGTMGAYEPLSVGPRAGGSGGGGSDVVGSPNYYSNQDKDKVSKNVTINNYYPEPERVSDTIAMQLRLARYA